MSYVKTIPGDYFTIDDDGVSERVSVYFYFTCPECGIQSNGWFMVDRGEIDRVKQGGWFEESNCEYCKAIINARYWSDQYRG